MQKHLVGVGKVLRYKIITDHYNIDAVKIKMLLNSKDLSFNEKTLTTEDQLNRAKAMGIKAFPMVYTSKNEEIGGLQDLIFWLDQFER